MEPMKRTAQAVLFHWGQTVLWITRSSTARHTKSAADFDKRHSRIVIPTEAEESSSFVVPPGLVSKQNNKTSYDRNR